MLYIERRANRGPGIVRCWLYVHIPEVRALEDHAIGHTVERHPTCQTNRGHSRLPLDKIQQRKVILLEHQLYGSRQVFVPLFDLRPRHPRFTKFLSHLVRKDRSQSRFPAVPGHLHTLTVMGEVVQIEPALIVLGPNHAPHFFSEPWLTIS